MMMKMENSMHTQNKNSKDYHGVTGKVDEEVPNLEPMSSYDASSTTAMSASTASPSQSMAAVITVPEHLVETSTTALQQVQLEEQLLAMAEDDVSLLSPDSSESQTKQYFAKQEFQTLLTPTFIESLEATTENYNFKKQAQRLRRKELIQRELEDIVRTTATIMAKDEGHEFEPEAVEALGIAANRVAYLKRYYDVTTCQYIYVPSVAYTILNGALLEEACKHYYGKSEEFLIAYAASLGTTVLQNGLPPVLQGQHLDCDDDDMKDDLLSDDGKLGLDSPQSNTASIGTTLSFVNGPTESTAASNYWGVSPLSTAQSVESSTNKFTFDASVPPTDDPVPAAKKDVALDSSVTATDGISKDIVAPPNSAGLDCIVTPMDSTFDYSVTPQNMTFHSSVTPNFSPADILGDFSFDSADEMKNRPMMNTPTGTPQDSTVEGSITPDSPLADKDLTWDPPGTPQGSIVHGSVMSKESPVDASDEAHVLPLDSSVTVKPVETLDAPVIPHESSVDDSTTYALSDKQNTLTVDSSIAATTHDSTQNGSDTPRDLITPFPDESQDSTLDSVVSVKNGTVDSSVVPEDCTIDASATPNHATSDSTFDDSVTPKDLIFHDSVKPYDSDSTCDVAAHDLVLDSSSAAFHSTLDSFTPKNLKSPTCATPKESTYDTPVTGKDSTEKECATPNKAVLESSVSPTVSTLDCSDKASVSTFDSSVTSPKDGSGTETDSKSIPVGKSSQTLFVLLAVVISLAIGAMLVFSMNNMPSLIEQQREQPRTDARQPSHELLSSLKAALGSPIQNWDSLEPLTTLQIADMNPVVKGSKEKLAAVPNVIQATSSTTKNPNGPEPTARTRPIVPNLLY